MHGARAGEGPCAASKSGSGAPPGERQWPVPSRRADQGSDCGAAQIHRSAQKSAARRNHSIGSGRLQEYNHPGAVFGRCEPAIWLHVVAGHNLIGFRDEVIELLLIPYKLRALHGTGIAVVRKRTGFSSDDIVEEIGRASCRERVYMWVDGRAVEN